jgi:hypothetical protein
MPYHLLRSTGFDGRVPVWYTRVMDQLSTLQEDVVIDVPAVVVEEPELPPLSVDEDSFALAVVECGGNLSSAYRMVFGEDAKTPMARGRALLAKPQIVARIHELSETIKESTLVSLGTHLQELSIIRDMAKVQGQLKIALQAERSRGEVVGLYNKFEHGDRGNGPVNVQINLVSKYDVNI